MMRFVELRCHSTRRNESVHLSQEGVTLARRVGQGMGPFARVVTSPSPWTYETAIAMGFAVDEQYTPVPFSNSEWREVGRLMPQGTPFDERATMMKKNSLGVRFAKALRDQWVAHATALPDGGRLLVVTHGGYIDNSAVACLPGENHGAWGANFGHCEGIRMGFEYGDSVSLELLRIPIA